MSSINRRSSNSSRLYDEYDHSRGRAIDIYMHTPLGRQEHEGRQQHEKH